MPRAAQSSARIRSSCACCAASAAASICLSYRKSACASPRSLRNPRAGSDRVVGTRGGAAPRLFLGRGDWRVEKASLRCMICLLLPSRACTCARAVSMATGRAGLAVSHNDAGRHCETALGKSVRCEERVMLTARGKRRARPLPGRKDAFRTRPAPTISRATGTTGEHHAGLHPPRGVEGIRCCWPR